jgi:hypothetical protein
MRRHSEGLLRQSSFKGVSAPTDRWRATLRKVISLLDDEKGAGVYGLLDLGTAIDCAARQRGRDFITCDPLSHWSFCLALFEGWNEIVGSVLNPWRCS